MSRQFTLESGLFGLCAGIWDEDGQSYRKASDTEVKKCCLNSCRDLILDCRSICDKNFSAKGSNPNSSEHKLCHVTCDDIILTCSETCILSDPNKLWGVDNPFFQATEKWGCGGKKKIKLNKECVQNQKWEIITNCQKICSDNNMSVDCTGHCASSYENLIDPSTNPLKNIPRDLPPNEKDKTKQNITIISYIGYALAISVILLGLYILFF